MARALLGGIAAALGFGTSLGALWLNPTLALFLAGFSLVLGAFRRLVVLLWLSAFFLGAALPRPTPPAQPLLRQLSLLLECTGYVVDLPEPTAKHLSFTVELPHLGTRLLAYCPRDLRILPGQRVHLRGQYKVPEPKQYQDHLLRRGIHGLFWAKEVTILSQQTQGVLVFAALAREKLFSLFSALPEKSQALLNAILLGSRGLLSPEEKAAFREAGVAHLLALSGLHVGIFAAGGWFILGFLRVPKLWRYIILIPLVGFYVLIGGVRVSLLRAGLMFGILGIFWILQELGWVAKRWLDPLQGLSLAAIVVLVIWPWSSKDAAFQLSFSATAGIILLLPYWTRAERRTQLRRPLRWLTDLAFVTLCAQLGVLPFLGSTFGYLTPYGLLANLVLVPWTTVLLWSGIFAIPVLAVPLTHGLAGYVLEILARPYLWLVQAFGELPGAVLSVGPNFGLWYMCVVLAFLILRAAWEEYTAG